MQNAKIEKWPKIENLAKREFHPDFEEAKCPFLAILRHFAIFDRGVGFFFFIIPKKKFIYSV